MNPADVQTEFFKQIQQKIAPRKLANDLVDILTASKSRAYRLINNEQSLSIEELAKIMAHYNTISFDKFVRPNQAPFVLPVLTNAPKNVFDYLDVIETDLEEAKQYPEALISYAAQDLLIFHYFLVPEIALFKLYMWDRTIWDFEESRYEPFDLDKQRQNIKLLAQIERIADAYALIDSEEVWNVNMLDVTLNQIQYCYLSGHFKDSKQVQYLLDLLKQLSRKLHNLAVLGHKKNTPHKTSSGKLSVWYNELIHNNALILARASETHRLVFSVFDSPNFMYSMDTSIYEKSQIFFDKLKKFSNCIDGAEADPARHVFFRRLNQKITFLEDSLAFVF